MLTTKCGRGRSRGGLICGSSSGARKLINRFQDRKDLVVVMKHSSARVAFETFRHRSVHILKTVFFVYESISMLSAAEFRHCFVYMRVSGHDG